MDTRVRNLKLTVEYDGTDFHGYQTQGKGERTVQSVLAEAVEKIVNQPVVLQTAGRTDTGVHALGQVVSFTTTGKVPAERLAKTGIDFVNEVQENDKYNVLDYMNIYTGAGVAAGDINNDGLPDIYFTNGADVGEVFVKTAER